MAFIEVQGKKIELNEEGFLKNPDLWNDEIASILALQEEGLNNLTSDHWQVIHFIRNHYLENKMAPMIRSICQSTGLKLKHIYELFPSGPAKGACKLAGLPKPDGCV